MSLGFLRERKSGSDGQILRAEQMLFMTGGLDRAFIVQRWRSGAMRIAACNQDQRLIEPRKEGERQSLVDIMAILNHILEIWPISHISCSLCSLGNILFRCKPKHQFQLPNIYFQLGRGLFVPKIHPNSLLSGLRGKPCSL